MGGNGFSSLKNFDTLKEAGFDEAQARAILEMMSQDSVSRQDLEVTKLELKRDIKELDSKIENFRIELKREIKELDTKIEANKAELKRDMADLKRDIKTLDDKIMFRMAAASAGVVLTILSCLVTLGKLGLLTPAP